MVKTQIKPVAIDPQGFRHRFQLDGLTEMVGEITHCLIHQMDLVGQLDREPRLGLMGPVLAGSPGLIRNRSHASPSLTGDLGIAMANPSCNGQCPDQDQGESNRHSATTNVMMGRLIHERLTHGRLDHELPQG